jgi:hypothetical protein
MMGGRKIESKLDRKREGLIVQGQVRGGWEGRKPVRCMSGLESDETSPVGWRVGGEGCEEDVIEDGEIESSLQFVEHRVLWIWVEGVEEVWSGRESEEGDGDALDLEVSVTVDEALVDDVIFGDWEDVGVERCEGSEVGAWSSVCGTAQSKTSISQG